MTERSIWILLFTPSPIMSAMSTISTAITSRVLPPRVFLSPNYFPLSRFRAETLLSEHSAPFDRKKFHPRTKLLTNNSVLFVCFLFFFYNSSPSRQRRLISIRNSWKLLTKFRKGFDRRLSQSILSTDTSFFKFEAIKVIEKNVK